MSEYYSRFIEAISKTKKLGLDPGDIILDRSISYVTKDTEDDLRELFIREMGHLSKMEQATCTRVSIKMLTPISKYFKTDVYLTTGNVKDNEIIYFDCDDEYIKSIIDNPMLRDKLHVHTWLTLSSGEIVDFTLLKGLALNTQFGKTVEKIVIVGNEAVKGLQLGYLPSVIGLDFFVKHGSVKF